MANKNAKNPENVIGRYYVDNDCIDCDICRNVAPNVFRRCDEGGYSYVHRQPQSPEEIALAEEARESCPAGTIGDDGE
ncbi:MAG TPA: ferredoxin [Alphaproteobacteria bacterium]|nr:ferredoxin [Alphaproteobacteria bacterium]